jgi:hypothetical protein
MFSSTLKNVLAYYNGGALVVHKFRSKSYGFGIYNYNASVELG